MLLRRQHPGQQRRGVVLIAVVIVIALLSLAAYQYSDLMAAEYKASDNAHRSVQAKAVADSGIHYAAALLSNPNNLANLLGGNPYSNEQRFANVRVEGDGKNNPGGRFYIIAPNPADPSVYRPGVTDESGKINLNALMKRDPTGKLLYDMLSKVQVPVDNWSEIAAAIVDWMDYDGQPRQGGAENDYYAGKSPSYRCKNGPLESVEELLLIKGIDDNPWLLFGDDKNRNGIQDDDENASSGEYFPGLVAFVTIHSREANTDNEGLALAHINDTDLTALYQQLAAAVGEDLAKFIIIYRQYGPATSSGSQQSFGGSIAALLRPKPATSSDSQTKQGKLSEYEPVFTKLPKTQIKSLFELVDVQVSISKTEQQGNKNVTTKTVYTSPLNDQSMRRDLLPKLFAKASIFESTEIPARINVNTAPKEVLMAIPDLTEADVESILNLRPGLDAQEPPSPIYQTPTWLLTDANLKASILKKLEPTITTKTQVYRVQVIGFLDTEPQTSARVEAVIDANNGRPRILAWRDLGEWGVGVPNLR